MASRRKVTYTGKDGRVSFLKGPERIRVGDVVEQRGRRLIVTGTDGKDGLKVIHEPLGWEVVKSKDVRKVQDRDRQK